MVQYNFPPWPNFTEEEGEAVKRVLLSNKVNYWSGEECREFENEFAEYVGTKFSVAVANSTFAFDFAMGALGIGKGDEVIVTSRTFLSSVSSIINSGATPIFADVDLDSQNITPETIKPLINIKTKAIVCLHFAGWPCEMDGIMALAKEHNLFVIEDCAQAHGAKYKGKSVGSIGHIGVWSFCQDQIMSTGGEGGFVTTNDEDLWKKMWSYIDNGKSFDEVYNKKSPQGYKSLDCNFGNNWRMTEIQAVLGRIQLKRLNSWHNLRIHNAKYLWNSLNEIDWIRIPKIPKHIDHGAYKAFVFLIPELMPSSIDKDKILKIFHDIGIPCFTDTCPEVYPERAFVNTDVKPIERHANTKLLCETSLTFLVHPGIEDSVYQQIREVLLDLTNSIGNYKEYEIKLTEHEKFIPFAIPDICDNEIQEVVETLKSGWITTGPKVKQFENDFSKYLGGKVTALAVNSATSGLHLALEAVGVRPGDEVLVPTYTFTSTAEVVRYLGADPIFVDSDPFTFNISITDLEKKITKKTKAIVPVHFGGLPVDMDEIIRIAKDHNLRIIEDAAHAFPTKYKGQLIGTLDTDATVFSFYANKTMTTGEGGMVVTKNSDIADRCKVMRLHGISRDAFNRYQSKTPAWYYEVIEPGFKYNMPDICAAIGIHQLKRIDEFYKKRVYLARVYDEQLSNLPLQLPARNLYSNSTNAYHLYPILLSNEAKVSRDEFIIKMSELGIGCSVHFIPLHKQPVWKDTYNLKSEQFPVAEKIYNREVSIPLFTKMTSDDQTRVISAIKSILT